jgi:hypothetical protein
MEEDSTGVTQVQTRRFWFHVKKDQQMNNLTSQQGKIGWILLWLLGVPIPILLVLFLVRGCT